MRFLLIISCSKRKNNSKNQMIAIERYDGVFYRIIKKLKRENKLPEKLDIIIISAKYGFLKSTDLIENYDLIMNMKQAVKLNFYIIKDLNDFISDKYYKDVFVNLGKEYMCSIKGFEKLFPNKTKIIIPKGGIGIKMKLMKNWIINIDKKIVKYQSMDNFI